MRQQLFVNALELIESQIKVLQFVWAAELQVESVDAIVTQVDGAAELREERRDYCDLVGSQIELLEAFKVLVPSMLCKFLY